MAIPPWTVELLRRGIVDVASKAGEPANLRRLKEQASGILQDLPESAARGIQRVIQTAESGKESVQRWSRRHTSLAVPLLNASGVLYHPMGTGVPIDQRVVDVGQEVLRGDVVLGAGMADRITRRLQRCFADYALADHGGVSIAIAASFPAALSAVSLVGTRRTLVIHRRHAVRLDGGVPLPEAFGCVLPMVTEVGGCDRIDAEDFEGIERPCLISADDGQTGFEPIELPGDAIRVHVLPIGVLADSPNRFVPSAESLLRGGADLVVLPGDAIAGGPPCGILVGRREEIDMIRESASWTALEASIAVHAMMAVAAETVAEGSSEIRPIDALISTSEDNLRDRAERLATRLSGTESIASARVTDDPARITEAGRWRIPSRQVVLTHAAVDAESWARKLAEDLPAVAVTAAEGTIRVDLRWLDPAHDGPLAESLLR